MAYNKKNQQKKLHKYNFLEPFPSTYISRLITRAPQRIPEMNSRSREGAIHRAQLFLQVRSVNGVIRIDVE